MNAILSLITKFSTQHIVMLHFGDFIILLSYKQCCAMVLVYYFLGCAKKKLFIP